MYKFLVLVSIFGIFISCKTVETTTIIEPPTLSKKEISIIESELVDMKRDLLYNKVDLAKVHLKRIFDIDSTHPVALYEKAKIELQDKNLQQAYNDIDQAIERDPKNYLFYKFRINMAQQLGQIQLVNRLYNELLALTPDDQELWFHAADYYLSSKQYKNALSLISDYEKKFGINDQILLNKYKLRVQLKELKELEKDLKTYRELYPNNPKVLELSGNFYLAKNDIVKGLEFYKKLLTITPDNPEALLALADYYRTNLDMKKSYSYIEKLMSSASFPIEGKIEVLFNFIQISQQDPQLEIYANDLITSLKAQYPNNSEVRLLYGNILAQQSKFEDAQKEFELSLDAQPNNLNAWIQLIIIDNELKSNESIIKHASKAIEYFPNQAELYYYKGLANMLLENYSESVIDLEFGNKITGKADPLKYQFLYLIGESYYNLDSIDLAFKYFDEALQINPNEISLLNNYAYYLSVLDKDLDKAENMSLKTIKEEPNNSTYLDTYAWILFQKEEYDKALTYIEKAVVKGGSSSSVIMEHYGDILYKLGKKEEALQIWKEAAKLKDPTDKLLLKVDEKKYVE
jgi:tetratricopeptide (TPR) repeat protein